MADISRRARGSVVACAGSWGGWWVRGRRRPRDRLTGRTGRDQSSKGGGTVRRTLHWSDLWVPASLIVLSLILSLVTRRGRHRRQTAVSRGSRTHWEWLPFVFGPAAALRRPPAGIGQGFSGAVAVVGRESSSCRGAVREFARTSGSSDGTRRARKGRPCSALERDAAGDGFRPGGRRVVQAVRGVGLRVREGTVTAAGGLAVGLGVDALFHRGGQGPVQ